MTERLLPPGSAADSEVLVERRTSLSVWLVLAGIMAGLSLTRLHSALLFHSLAEGFAIAGAIGVFIIAWHSRGFLRNGCLGFLGIAYLFVAALDLAHTLTYPGTGVLQRISPQIPLQLWLASRLLEAVSLCIAPGFLGHHIRYNVTFAALALGSGVILTTVFAGGFPAAMDQRGGATTFTLVVEGIILVLLAWAAVRLWRRRHHFDPEVAFWLVGSVVATILSELLFIAGSSFPAEEGMGSILFKIVAFYLLYKALIETGLVRPFNLLFRDLARSEEALRGENIELARLQRELAERNVELERLNQVKNQFMGMVAHDLRSPLAAITWYSEVLMESLPGKMDGQTITFVGRIRETSQFMLTLVDDLLDVSAIETGKLRLNLALVDLPALVEANAALNRVLADRKGIRLEVRRRGGGTLQADPTRLEQVLTNLVSNAVKYSAPDTTVTVEVDSGDAGFTVRVRDQGQGIPLAEQEKLFQIYATTSIRGTAGEKSTGLGLAIARKIVEAHGGTIGLESAPGQGTTVSFTLPRAGS
jgi:signal transduction histidine kinase